jgi:hypothetical protein
MRKVIAWVSLYSLDGLLAYEGTEYWHPVPEDGRVGQHHHRRW